MKKLVVVVFTFIAAFVVMFGMVNIGNPEYGFHKTYSVEMLGDGDRYEGHYYERKRRINNENWIVDSYFDEEGTVEQIYISEETGNSFTIKENSGLYGKLYCWLLVK